MNVAYGADLEAALGAVRDVLAANARVLKDPAPLFAVSRLEDSGIRIGVNPWVNAPEFGAATGELNHALLAALRARGIPLARPQRDIRMLAAA